MNLDANIGFIIKNNLRIIVLRFILLIITTAIGLVGYSCAPVSLTTTTSEAATVVDDRPVYSEHFILDSIRVVLNYTPQSRHIKNLVIFFLPNGNSIEWTMGKQTTESDDWHFGIQHIDAQTRWLRDHYDQHLAVAYLEAPDLSWPHWKKTRSDRYKSIHTLMDTLRSLIPYTIDEITLSSHSGGGSLINGFIESVDSIPAWVNRIVFIDSNYGYESAIGEKLATWLQQEPLNHLSVFAYNDSVALYEGKSFVSATGGTWYRSKMMLRELSETFEFEKSEGEELIHYRSSDNQVLVILKKNPLRKIFHTEQVALNGFIHSQLFGTGLENQGYKYFENACYASYIQRDTPSFNSPSK